jgi:hypothetical protein
MGDVVQFPGGAGWGQDYLSDLMDTYDLTYPEAVERVAQERGLLPPDGFGGLFCL